MLISPVSLHALLNALIIFLDVIETASLEPASLTLVDFVFFLSDWLE
jgi:hypothetical protein